MSSSLASLSVIGYKILNLKNEFHPCKLDGHRETAADCSPAPAQLQSNSSELLQLVLGEVRSAARGGCCINTFVN